MSARSFDLNSTKKQGIIQVTDIVDQVGDLRAKTVRLHGSAVFRVFPHERKLQLDSCGYKTATTKVAINRALEQLMLVHRVVQKKGTWYVSTPDSKLIEFTDGMSINL